MTSYCDFVHLLSDHIGLLKSHDWTIRVHSHRRLAQVFLFRTPGVDFILGDVEYLTTQPTLLVVCPSVPHGFKFSEDVVGDVLSVRVDQTPAELNDRFEAFASPTTSIFQETETRRFADIAILFEQLQKAYRSLGGRRTKIMRSLVDPITLYLMGEQSEKAVPIVNKANELRDLQDTRAQEFCVLLEENFHRPWAVADYATEMGLSASHLTRLCGAVLEAPPNFLVRQRRILEAKRLLEYTSLPITEVANRSGFRDIAFFSRTFKSLVGVAPKDYRFRSEQ